MQLRSLPANDVDEELDLPYVEFLNSINRGRLVKPTDFVYNLMLHCWRVFEEVWTNADLKSQVIAVCRSVTAVL